MGVCCIVFDIDGMLFEFFMNFLNIEKNNVGVVWGVGGWGCNVFLIFYAIYNIHVLCYFQH